MASPWDWAKKAAGYTPTGFAARKAWEASDPNKGYDQAAGATRQAAGQYGQLGNDQWNRSMQGMGQAQGYLNPAWGYANQGQGSFENAWQGLSSQAAGPGMTGQAWGYVQGQLYQDPASKGAYGDLQNFAGQQSKSGSLWDQYQAPNAYSQAYGQSQGFFQSPGLGQNAYNQFSGQFSGPGSGEQWYQQNQGQFNRPSNTQRLYENNFGGYGDQSYAEKAYDRDINSALSNAKTSQEQLSANRAFLATRSATERAAGEVGGMYREAGDLARGAQQSEGFAASQLPGMQSQGLHEQFVASAMQGDNPYLARIENQGLARLNQEMARRGHFDSGGANTAIGNYLGEMGAQKFKALGDMTQSAQQMGLQRAQVGQGLAESSDRGRLARGQGIQSSGGALQSLAGQQEGERMARTAMDNALVAQQFGMGMEAQKYASEAARAADDARFRRMAGRDALGAQGDATALDYLKAGGDFSFRAQDAGETRATRGYGMANQQDQANLSRIMAMLQSAGMQDQIGMQGFNQRMNLANQVDQTGLARLVAQMQGAGQLDQASLAHLGMMMQGAGQYDSNMLGRLGFQAGLAGRAQDFETQRQLNAYNMLAGAGGAQANNVGNFYGAGMGAYGDAMDSSIAASLDADRLRAMAPGRWSQLMQLGGHMYGNVQQGTGMIMGASGGGMGGGGGAPSPLFSQQQGPPPSYYGGYPPPSNPYGYSYR